MIEPISIVSLSLQVAQILGPVVIALGKAYTEGKNVHRTLYELHSDLSAVRELNENINRLFSVTSFIEAIQEVQRDSSINLIASLERALQSCAREAQKLRDLLSKFGLQTSDVRLKQAYLQWRLDRRLDDIEQLKRNFQDHKSSIQLAFQVLTTCKQMQTAERDALRATELKTQISELHNAIQQISRQITTRQADPGDEEETQLLDEMKDIQATSVNLQRQATLRLEYLTALVEVTEAGVATKESDLRAVSSGIYAPKQSSPLPVSKDNEFAVSLSANTLSMSPKATSPKPSSPRGTQGSDLSFPSPNILSQISELASSETLASTPPTSPQPTMQSLEFTPSTNVFISAKEFEERLSSLLNSANSKRMGINKPFSDDFIVCIADILVAVGKHTWSERPRTYLVLRLINEVKVMDDFVLEGFKDIDFPYTDSTLPSCIITTGARHEFLQKQRFVLSARSADLVQGGRHHHLDKSANNYFTSIDKLGSGGFSVVDRVRSRLTLQEYARKRIERSGTVAKNRKALASFENEVHNLKRLSHHHLVKFVGSYTDKKYIGIIMQPVADTDLSRYLASQYWTPESLATLRSFIGCLCSTLLYLHENKCRHKDLKPQNILIKGDTVLIADFGTAFDWTESHSEITTGPPEAFTKLYVAPEVGLHKPRDTSSDIWSLGCVFLEIATILSGKSLQSKSEFFGSLDSSSAAYWRNHEAISPWVTLLRNVSGNLDAPIFEWIESMTAVEPSNRPTAEDLVTQVLTAQNGEVRYGRSCCFEDFDSETTSWEGSVVEDEIFETAQTASNVTTWSSGSMPTPQPLAEEQIPQKELSHLLLSDPKTTPPATLGATYCASSIPSAISSGLEESQMSSKSNMLNPGAGEISISNPTKREKPETIERPRIEQYEPHHLQVAPSPDEPRTTNILVSSKDDAEIQAAKNVEYIPKNHQRLESYLLSLKGRDPNWRSQLSVLIEQGTCDSKGYNILSVACKFNNTALAQDILETVVDKNPELINKLNRYKNSALHYAASKGRTKMVETLIQNGAMPSIRNCLNQTALHIALKLRKENTVKLLCQHLSSDQMNAGDDNGWTLLHVACCYNAPIEIIHQLLAAGAEPNLQDYWGFTPFQRSNDTDVRKLLQSHILRECPEFEEPSPIPSYREWIKRFKEQDIPDCKCSICAMITILYNSLDSIEEKHDCCLCLTHLRIFARDALLASINGCEDALRLCECVRCVSGREYNAKNRPCPISTSYDGERESLRAPPPFTDPPKLLSGETFANKPLPPYPGHEYYDRLVKEEISRSAPNLSQQEMMAVALKSLADAGFKGTRRSYRTNPESAMKWVICNLQHLAHANTIVEILLNCGADVDTLGPPELKASLLYVASRNQDLAMMELLLEKKAGVDFPTTWKYKDCITPLRGAIRLGKTLSARTLLRAGANVDDQYSGDKSSLLHEAILRYDVAGGHIPLLLGHGASTELRDRDKNTPLHVAVTQKNLYAAMALLDGGADVEAIGKGGESPLSMALNTGNYEMVSKLLEYGANVYINCGIATSALFKAVKRSYVDIVRLLLEEYSAGEDIRRINKMGHSVLHLLTEASIYDEAVINAIMGYGSSVDAEGIGGWTPLHFAAYHGNIVMVKKLLEHGATIHLQNHDGHTPLDYAQSKRHPRIVECLGGTFKKSWWRRL